MYAVLCYVLALNVFYGYVSLNVCCLLYVLHVLWKMTTLAMTVKKYTYLI